MHKQRFTIQQIKQANQAAGHFFFTRDTMRFFGNTMRDFSVRHIDTPEGTEVYVVAVNHRAPMGVDKRSVYRFTPDDGHVSSVDLTVDDLVFMRRIHSSMATYKNALACAAVVREWVDQGMPGLTAEA